MILKKCVLGFAAIFLTVSAVYAQSRNSSRPRHKVQVSRKARPHAVREKFDPARIPKMDLEKAIAEAGKSGKRIILDVGGEWCGWCIHMDKYIAGHAALARLRSRNFIWVKVNYSEENENKDFLSAYPAIEDYPHLFVLDETGKLLHSQDTSELEKQESYDLTKFTAFLKAWAPERKPVLLLTK
jgi:thioredoxin-related protein